MYINNFSSTYSAHFSSPLSKSLYSFSFHRTASRVCLPLNEREIAVQNKSSSTPSLSGIRHLFIRRSLFARKEGERQRESENKRANKVKVNPLVYCSYSLYSSACNYYWKINIFFIPVERNYCYKIKKTALPLALTIYIYIYIRHYHFNFCLR